jgi:uncharacterized membrane protein
MSASKRPVAVLIVACLYIAVGAVGLVHHFPRPMVFHQDDIWIELTELLAIIIGVFLLRGHNWARWLAIAWMAFHVAISWPAVRQLAIHTIILAAIAWLLFRADARQFFTADRSAG